MFILCHFQINIGFFFLIFQQFFSYRCIEHRHNISMLGILVMKEAHPHGLTRQIVTLRSLSLLLHQTILMESWLREFLKVIMWNTFMIVPIIGHITLPFLHQLMMILWFTQFPSSQVMLGADLGEIFINKYNFVEINFVNS